MILELTSHDQAAIDAALAGETIVVCQGNLMKTLNSMVRILPCKVPILQISDIVADTIIDGGEMVLLFGLLEDTST